MTSTVLETSVVETAGTVETVRLPERTVVGLRNRMAPAAMSEFFRRAIATAAAELDRRGISPDGPPTVVYRRESGHMFDVTVGFPVRWVLAADELPAATGPSFGALAVEKLPAGRVARAEHAGPYETMKDTYAALGEWFGEHTYQPPAVMWEEYLVGPGEADESGYRTRVVYPLG